MKHGGARPGSGRKKGVKTLDKEMARQRLRELVLAKMDPLVEAQVKHAQGISYLVYRDPRGGKFTKVEPDADLEKLQEGGGKVIEVWSKEPSVQAFTDLMNRAIDKPAETVNATMVVSTKVEDRIKAGRDRLAKVKRGNGSKPIA